jgi:hypothetical protein
MNTGTSKVFRSLAFAIALGVLGFGTSGCMDVTLHEPGVYKGATDPLLEKQADAAHIEALQERFVKGQSDR